MSQLAIQCALKGDEVTGSDDEIFNPSKTNLENHQLLPAKMGWFPDKITKLTEAVIVGMHAKKDNSELIKAQNLKIPIYSYPEYIYQQTKNKKRVVVAGSHGKTTITAMVMHVLKAANINFDYLVGASLEGFKYQIKLTKKNSIIIIEGDEYLSSPIHKVPKITYYQPNITSISGIAWDHINVFPTAEAYVKIFEDYLLGLNDNTVLIYYKNDENLKQLVENLKQELKPIAYQTPEFIVNNGIFELINEAKNTSNTQNIPLQVFGEHNLQNIACARLICNQLAVSDEVFYQHIKSFAGASRRLQLLKQGKSWAVYNDFAHAPSKVEATVNALKQLWPTRRLICILELHTYSSLNKNFINTYKNTLDKADEAVVYYNQHTFEIKKLPNLSGSDVETAFNHHKLKIITEKAALENYLNEVELADTNVLAMTSGNLSGISLDDLLLNT